MKYSIALVGSSQLIAPFAALGYDTFIADSAESARDILFQLKKEKLENSQRQKYGIVFVVETVLQWISDEDYKKLAQGALPAIISLPTHEGASGFGESRIKRIVEKAIGADIFN